MRFSRVDPGMLLAVGVSILMLTGCSRGSAHTPTETPFGSSPPMTGPWAAEFEDAYASATSDVERSALEDGVISEQEYAEMLARFTTCVDDTGISFDGFKPDGSSEFEVPSGMSTDRGNELMDECSLSSGESTVGAVYHWVNRNPENLDENEIMAQCLIDSDVVDPSYTAEDFAADEMEETMPWTTDAESGHEALRACNSDPLGLLGMRNP